jgi:hypothetical protein
MKQTRIGKKQVFAVLSSIVLAFTLAALPQAGAQAASQSIEKPFVHPRWSGVWQSTLDGVPSVTLTLADDAGEANGTIVFHAIGNDHGHAYSFSTEPHTLIQPQIQGDTISFEVRRGNGSAEILEMAVELNQDGDAKFTCSNCGPQGTKADLVRLLR